MKAREFVTEMDGRDILATVEGRQQYLNAVPRKGINSFWPQYWRHETMEGHICHGGIIEASLNLLICHICPFSTNVVSREMVSLFDSSHAEPDVTNMSLESDSPSKGRRRTLTHRTD